MTERRGATGVKAETEGYSPAAGGSEQRGYDPPESTFAGVLCRANQQVDTAHGLHIGVGFAQASDVDGEICHTSSFTRSASERVKPTVAAISSTGASRIVFTVPNLRSSAFFRFGPTPGTASSADCIERFFRRPRW